MFIHHTNTRQKETSQDDSTDKAFLKEWQINWNKSETADFFRKICPYVGYISHIRIDRPNEIKMTRLRFGITLLNDNLHKHKINPDRLWQTCKTPDTAEHYLMNCE